MTKRRVEPTDAMIGKILRETRIRLGLTQKDVATRANITFQQIQKYETGVTRVSISRFFEICRIFGMSPTDLVSKLEKIDIKSNDKQPGLNKREMFLQTRIGNRLITRLSEIEDPELLDAVSRLIATIETGKTNKS